jgi:hypothetical protein
MGMEVPAKPVVSTNDEQRRRLHTRQRITREIGPSAARDNGIDPPPDFGRSHRRCTGAGARSEIADATTKEVLEQTGGDVMIVGHLPLLGKLVALLVTGSEENEIVEFQFGSVVCIERRDDGKWKLAWMITPALLHG